MKKIFLPLLILFILFSLTGCAQLKRDALSGISVKDSSVTLGGQPPVQKVSYRLVLHNGGRQTIRVDSVKPVVDAAFKAMMGKQELVLTVGKDIPAGEDLVVSGKFQLKTNGIPKEELAKMGKLVKSFQIATRTSFAAPELENETAKKPAGKTEAASEPKAAPTAKP